MAEMRGRVLEYIWDEERIREMVSSWPCEGNHGMHHPHPFRKIQPSVLSKFESSHTFCALTPSLTFFKVPPASTKAAQSQCYHN